VRAGKRLAIIGEPSPPRMPHIREYDLDLDAGTRARMPFGSAAPA
jgi:hypothetical protein